VVTPGPSHPDPKPTPDPASDEALFDRYRAGDDAALRSIVERYQPELLRFLVRLTGDRPLADDVFQETFLQVHLSGHTFDSSRRFRPWIFTIAANKARDAMRRKHRRRALELSAPVSGAGGASSNGSDAGGVTFVDLMQIDIPPPSAAAEDKERDAQVQRALELVSPTLREMLLLAYFQRLTYAQIAAELGIPLGTVKSRLHAAVASFARAWQRTTGQELPGSRGGVE
jgi:RNA polymerase sigma-70 factor (ECF subfamily)